jgi:hypothetical protein
MLIDRSMGKPTLANANGYSLRDFIVEGIPSICERGRPLPAPKLEKSFTDNVTYPFDGYIRLWYISEHDHDSIGPDT